jgi:hypothetical protein
MNYINKLKKLGFKRCEPLLVCEYSQYQDNIDGYYIESALDIYQKIKGDWTQTYKYSQRLAFGQNSGGFDTSGKCRFQTYRMDVCQEVKIYVTILNDTYWTFIQNDLIPDEPFEFDKRVTSKKNVAILLENQKISPYFWSQIQEKLDLGVLRMVRLNNLFA